MVHFSFRIIFIFICIGVLITPTIKVFGQNNELYQTQNLVKSKLSLLDYNALIKTKSLLSEPEFVSSYSKLLNEADKSLKQGPLSVVQKTQIPPSGDKHDYISYGPYWWPDPDKPDGLPWIRRDGEINPLTREGNTDFETKNAMFKNTTALSLSYFFSDEEKYGDKTLELLKIWFLDEDTKMNPNLNFAQGIPGINTGRGIGIIEFAGITNIITAIELLELQNKLDTDTGNGLKHWFTEYLSWLQTSNNGIFEKNTKNNHAVWYDVQEVSILMFLKRFEEAKSVLERVKSRIATQIEPNGEQPHELARTKALSYSTMNLRGFTQLAYYGKKLGIDLWNFETKKGSSIKSAYEFLKPYALGQKKWEYQQISDLEKALTSLQELFVQAGSQFEIEAYCAFGKRNTKEGKILIYNCN